MSHVFCEMINRALIELETFCLINWKDKKYSDDQVYRILKKSDDALMEKMKGLEIVYLPDDDLVTWVTDYNPEERTFQCCSDNLMCGNDILYNFLQNVLSSHPHVLTKQFYHLCSHIFFSEDVNLQNMRKLLKIALFKVIFGQTVLECMIKTRIELESDENISGLESLEYRLSLGLSASQWWNQIVNSESLYTTNDNVATGIHANVVITPDLTPVVMDCFLSQYVTTTHKLNLE